jgi:hypothetical protein
VSSITTSQKSLEILEFPHFYEYYRFVKNDDNSLKKVKKDRIIVSVVVDMVCVNTSKI